MRPLGHIFSPREYKVHFDEWLWICEIKRVGDDFAFKSEFFMDDIYMEGVLPALAMPQ